MITLTITGPYTAKDQIKASQATKFIGRGSPRSSTAQYAKDFGLLANCGDYAWNDIVFVSAEGARTARLEPDLQELALATGQGATILTDGPASRTRAYNVGERQVAEFLLSQGYVENRSGRWNFVL